MFSLTRQEQMIVAAIIAALLVGAAVKHWRENRGHVEQATTQLSGGQP